MGGGGSTGSRRPIAAMRQCDGPFCEAGTLLLIRCPERHESMLNFLIFAALAAAVILAVSWPVLKARTGGPARAQYDEAVFRDQLAELERDKARGLIGGSEAEAARNEIARRLLSVNRTPEAAA